MTIQLRHYDSGLIVAIDIHDHDHSSDQGWSDDGQRYHRATREDGSHIWYASGHETDGPWQEIGYPAGVATRIVATLGPLTFRAVDFTSYAYEREYKNMLFGSGCRYCGFRGYGHWHSFPQDYKN